MSKSIPKSLFCLNIILFFSCLQEFAESALHKAISHENGHSLHIVDFIVQNSCSLDKQSREGNTPLHYCVIQDQSESMRLLLRAGANASVENNNGKSPLAIAKERNHHLCEEMVSYFYSFKSGSISEFFFLFGSNLPKKVQNHYPEHLLFRWKVFWESYLDFFLQNWSQSEKLS